MKDLFVLYLLTSVAFSVNAATNSSTDHSMRVTGMTSSMQLAFTENQGQWDDQVKFRADAGGATMWFAPDGAYYQFTRTIKSDDDGGPYSVVDKRYANGRYAFGGPTSAPDMIDREPDSVETMMIKASFVNANPGVAIKGTGAMEYKCNYFIGNDPNEWHTDVPNYSAVLYEQIYDGIDLKYYGNGKQMEYDFIVEPGADYSQIRIEYEGAESISINADGKLVVETKWGEVVEQKPVIYQMANGSRVAVDGKYSMKGTSAFGFELRDYDPTLPLIIDPVLSYSTYLGGTAGDVCGGIAVDRTGNAYVTGSTASTNFPTEGAYQVSNNGGGRDAFVTKLNSTGNGLVFSTYLGGTDRDIGADLVVDGSGNVYITGHTRSTDFPTHNAFQQIYQGDLYDAFVTKLSSSGNILIYSTYLGGDSQDNGEGIAIDDYGSAYITGYTNSSDFPVERGYQETHQDSWDAFVTKLSVTGQTLVYSTYLGGSMQDFSYDIGVDGSGNAYIAGFTSSSDFPTVGAHQTLQGYSDIFVTKLSSFGDNLVYSTYLGGSDEDRGLGLSLDGSDNAYITGVTWSPDFPTKNAYQSTKLGDDGDAFVIKLNGSGNTVIYSTLIGGSLHDMGDDIAVDGSGNAFITGQTFSTDFPLQEELQSYSRILDVFVTKISNSGSELVYSTYLGGNGVDIGFSIAVDGFGDAYITGRTDSADFPTTGEYQSYQGFDDAFVTKLSEPACCVGIRGDVNGDGEDLNIIDLTCLVDFLWGDGCNMICAEEVDANGDGEPGNIVDLTFIVDWLFGDAPTPVACP